MHPLPATFQLAAGSPRSFEFKRLNSSGFSISLNTNRGSDILRVPTVEIPVQHLTINAPVNASMAVSDTGFKVNPGDQIHVVCDPNSHWQNGQGGDWQQTNFAGYPSRGNGGPRFALPGATEGCLLFRIGSEPWRYLGGNFDYTVLSNENGTIQFTDNDDTQMYGDNTGTLQLTVTITKPDTSSIFSQANSKILNQVRAEFVNFTVK